MLCERLRTRLEAEPDVQVAYLYGSTARGTDGPLSDVDIAVLLDGSSDPWQRRLDLIAAVGKIVGEQRADVVVLNDAPPTLAYRVLRDGELLACRDESARVRHWVEVVDRYLDMAPVRRRHASALRRRVQEGRFGRP